MARIITLTGPSGCGKTSIIKILMELFPNQITKLITSTTRRKRPHEEDGRDYYFYQKDEFLKHEFIETTEYNNNLYGMEKSEAESKLNGPHSFVFVVVDRQGVQHLKDLFPNDVTSIYIRISPSRAKYRLQHRHSSEDIRQKIEADKEAGLYDEKGYDFIVSNNTEKMKFCQKIIKILEEFSLLERGE